MEDIKFYEKLLGVNSDTYFWKNDKIDNYRTKEDHEKWNKQKEEFGFDDRETWCLKSVFALFIFPRIKRFVDREPMSFPIGITYEKWLEILNKMARSFELVILDDVGTINIDDYNDEVEEGLKLFAEYYFHLWD